MTGRVAKTNVASNTAFRGFGGPQAMLVIEEIMDRVARATGLPAEVVRERNLYHGSGETNTTHYGADVGDNRVQTLWRMALDNAKFADRRREIEAWNRARRGVKRGLAVTPVKFGISFTFDALQSRRGARARLPGWNRAGESRRHGDGARGCTRRCSVWRCASWGCQRRASG